MMKQFCAGSFCTRSITAALPSSFIAGFASLKNTNSLLTLAQTHSAARGTQCTVTHIPRKRRYDIIIIICSGLVGILEGGELRQEGGEEGREGIEKK